MAQSDFFFIDGACASFGKREVIKNISFSLEKGTLTALLGVNGSGKSTLMRTICSFCGTYENCTLDGEKLKNLSRKKMSALVSYIPQRSGITFSSSVLDVVLLGFNPHLKLLENPNEKHKQAACKALRDVGLEQRKDDDYLTLSEGQKQLCILARTIVQDTKLLLLDEPDSSLDFLNRRLVLQTLKSLVEEKDKTALICMHDPAFALEFCDKILVLSDSSICDELYPKKDSEHKIEHSLSKIYGKVEVFRHNGKLFMAKE